MGCWLHHAIEASNQNPICEIKVKQIETDTQWVSRRERERKKKLRSIYFSASQALYKRWFAVEFKCIWAEAHAILFVFIHTYRVFYVRRVSPLVIYIRNAKVLDMSYIPFPTWIPDFLVGILYTQTHFVENSKQCSSMLISSIRLILWEWTNFCLFHSSKYHKFFRYSQWMCEKCAAYTNTQNLHTFAVFLGRLMY